MDWIESPRNNKSVRFIKTKDELLLKICRDFRLNLYEKFFFFLFFKEEGVDS